MNTDIDRSYLKKFAFVNEGGAFDIEEDDEAAWAQLRESLTQNVKNDYDAYAVAQFFYHVHEIPYGAAIDFMVGETVVFKCTRVR